MPYNSLREFVLELQKANELLIIDKYISPQLEMTEIIDRLSKNNGKAILFTNNGTSFPVLMNAFGSQKRMLMALSLKSYNEFEKRINNLFKILLLSRKNFKSKFKSLALLKELSYFYPIHKKGRGVCQENILTEPDLSLLPILKCWPYDGGKFITLPMVHTRDPETGNVNVGIYRMQVINKNTTLIHWHRHKDSAMHFRKYKMLKKIMPVVVTLGGDPIYTYCASAPLPYSLNEYMFSGFIGRKRVKLRKCLTCDIEIPDNVDFVLEGYINPEEELVTEGPFGDHTGFYSLTDKYPLFHIKAITYKNDAIYPATVVGIPPMEDAFIGEATQKLFSPLIKLLISEIEDIYLPKEGCFHNLAIVSINKIYPGQAVKVMNAIWSLGQLMFTKNIIVVDKDICVSDAKSILKAIITNVQIPVDLHFMHGPLDVLDHASTKFTLGKKLGIDATKKLEVEIDTNYVRYNNYFINTDEILQTLPCIRAIRDIFPEDKNKILVFFVDKFNSPKISEIHNFLLNKINVQYIIYLDSSVVEFSDSELLWLFLANFDPEKDIFIDKNNPFTNLGLDGTLKRKSKNEVLTSRPNVITMSNNIIEKIDNLWDKLNIGPFLSSPSKKYFKITNQNGYLLEL